MPVTVLLTIGALALGAALNGFFSRRALTRAGINVVFYPGLLGAFAAAISF